uniref:Zn(2)-C6 fungal-type domain-containing protein n=1 Tax=Cryptococcus bacillisporus CA1280 TaxID=1296109 RepID=A0A0D0VLK0_CRYGA|nr:hypothetical protein I312_04845 [Cryptococcus bacillisporus CA1280]
MDPPADSPRQAGRPPKRIRTTKPCDYCKQKKIRCQFPQEQDGTTSKTLPCEHCVQFGLVCVVAGVERQNQQPAMLMIWQSSLVSAQSARSARPSASVRPASRTRDSVPPVEPNPSVPARELGPRTSEEADPPIPFTTAPEAFAPPPPLPPVHLRLYYLDVAYKHIQARYACLDWLRIRRWHEQADSICGPVNGGWGNGANHDSRMAAFFLWLVYGYGARMTEDINLPGAVSHELGRPFLFHDEDIDIQTPLNIDDHLSVEEVIARLQESADIADNSDANVDYASDVTTVILTLTNQSDATYRVNQLSARGQSSVTIDAILEDLNRWRSRHPLAKNPGDCPVQLPEDHWEMEYHHNQWKQIQRDPRNLSISALYRLFLSGLTLIYLGLNHSSPTTVTPIILADVRSCLQSLNVFVNQLPWATAYRDCFAQLNDRFETRMAWQSFAAPTNGPESSGVPPSEGQQRAAMQPNDSTNQQWGIDGTGGQPIGFPVGQDYPTFGGADDLEFEA